MVNTLLMVSITPKQIRDSLEDKSMSLTHFYLMQGKKKIDLVCISNKQIIFWH